MPPSKAVVAVFVLIAVINVIWAIPNPSITRERHVIRTPIKFRTVHHYKVKKVPIIIKKHVHYYKPHNNHVTDDDDDDDGEEFEFHHEENRPKFKRVKPSFPNSNRDEEEEEQEEEEYEEPQQSPEEEYDDYEYE